MAIAQDDRGPGMNHRFAVRKRAAELDGHRELTGKTDRLARLELDCRRVLMAHDDSLEETKIIDPANQKPGVAMHRSLSHPLENQGHRQDGVPVDDVSRQDRDGFQIHLAAEDRLELFATRAWETAPGALEAVTSACLAAAATTTSSTAEPASCRASSTTSFAPASRGMSESPSCSKIGLSAAVTMPPAQGPQLKETTRQLGKKQGLLLGPLVEVLVGGRIGDLARLVRIALKTKKKEPGARANRDRSRPKDDAGRRPLSGRPGQTEHPSGRRSCGQRARRRREPGREPARIPAARGRSQPARAAPSHTSTE